MFQKEDFQIEEQEKNRSLSQYHTSSGSGSGYGDVQHLHTDMRDTYSTKVSSESGSVPKPIGKPIGKPVKLVDRYLNDGFDSYEPVLGFNNYMK